MNCAHYTVSVVDSTIHNLNTTNETTSTTTPLPPKNLIGIARNPRVALATGGGSGPLDPPVIIIIIIIKTYRAPLTGAQRRRTVVQ